MSKIDLEVKIESLRTMVLDSQQQTSNYTGQLVEMEKQLKDLDKPELTPSQLDDIYEAVETGVGEFDFSDQDNFDTEFELDYDNKVTLSELELCNHQDLVQMIVDKVNELFVETIDDEEGNKGPGNE